MEAEEIVQLEKNSEILRQKIMALLRTPKVYNTPIRGLSLAYRDCPNEIEQCFFKPITVSLLAGRKYSIFGSEVIEYCKNQTMVSGVDIPCATQVTEASAENPYFAVILELDALLLLELLKEIQDVRQIEATNRSVGIADSDPYIIEAYSRLVDLLGQSEAEQKMLAPMIIREIHYRLLLGPLGGMLRMVNTSGTKGNQVARAVSWIRENFKHNFKIEDLASIANMAPSSFYRNFNKVTTLSPIQYQKKLRLYEAQRLMLIGQDPQNAAYEVGYESPTQFYREYKRMFGKPPKRDIKYIIADN